MGRKAKKWTKRRGENICEYVHYSNIEKTTSHVVGVVSVGYIAESPPIKKRLLPPEEREAVSGLYPTVRQIR
jgi:hypothetical protein